MENIILQNFGYIKSKISKLQHKSLLKECLRKQGKEEFKSGLTDSGVPKTVKHYYVSDSLDTVYEIVDQMIQEYVRTYPNYLSSIKILDKHSPMEYQRPWINYQKKGDHLPIHTHDGILSYNIWIKIPVESVFEFNYTSAIGTHLTHRIYLDKKNEGDAIIFPSNLQHIVYPFEKSNDTRLSISGNIVLKGA
jgi:hypothetical protein